MNNPIPTRGGQAATRSRGVLLLLVLDDKYRGLDRKLTLIYAPVGFGKATLMSKWALAASSL